MWVEKHIVCVCYCSLVSSLMLNITVLKVKIVNKLSEICWTQIIIEPDLLLCLKLLLSRKSLSLSLSASLRLSVQSSSIWPLLLAPLPWPHLSFEVPRWAWLQLPAAGHMLWVPRPQQPLGPQETRRVSGVILYLVYAKMRKKRLEQ